MQLFSVAFQTIYTLPTSYCLITYICKIVWRCHVVLYVVMGVVASDSSPSAYMLGLIRRIDRGVPNATILKKVLGHILKSFLNFILTRIVIG